VRRGFTKEHARLCETIFEAIVRGLRRDQRINRDKLRDAIIRAMRWSAGIAMVSHQGATCQPDLFRGVEELEKHGEMQKRRDAGTNAGISKPETFAD